jgi:hypothetical protein
VQRAVETWNKEIKEAECAAGVLQPENTTVSNKEDVVMSDGHSTTTLDDESYFPEVVLDWDLHKSLVKCSDIVSKELTIVSRNGELTTSIFISAQSYTFKWHRTVSDKVVRALLEVMPNKKLTNISSTKGPCIRMLK